MLKIHRNAWPALALCAALVNSLALSNASAQTPARRGAESPNNPCGPIYTRHYGPFDYRTQRGELKIVEDFHFTPKVEALVAGSSGYIGGDLNYTLLSSPNHHRALLALMRWGEKTKSEQTSGMSFALDCYFDRAIRFTPDDTVVRAFYARFLHSRKRTDEALAQMAAGAAHAGDSALSHYNLGLVYLEIGQPELALAQAHKAMAMGMMRTALKDQLQAAGKWQEPPPNRPAAP